MSLCTNKIEESKSLASCVTEHSLVLSASVDMKSYREAHDQLHMPVNKRFDQFLNWYTLAQNHDTSVPTDVLWVETLALQWV